MILNVGRIYKSRLSFLKRTFIFEYGDHALVLEQEKGEVTLYATNAACSVIYCKIPLGSHSALKKKPFVAICYSENLMLLDGSDVLIVVDFEEKKVAVNVPEIRAIGKKDWGEDVQTPWKSAYNVMFGLPGDELDVI